MTLALLVLLFSVPAAANPAAMTNTLEALRSQAAADPADPTSRENASARAGKSFDQSFTIQTLTPVEYLPLTGAPRKNPPPQIDEKPQPPRKETVAGTPNPGEDKKTLNGITIDTHVKAAGSTSGGASPTDKYGTYAKYAVIGGMALIGVGLLLGGTPLVALALVGGLLIGAGAVLSFLFGEKK